jgi:ABC-type uncharacterized transport system involved in gliding motility auxiliary subunit
MARLRLPKVLITPIHLSRRLMVYLRLLLLLLVIVPVIVSSGRWLHVSRMDLTTDHLYTLTPGTLKIVDTLRHPLNLTLYFSSHATRDLPQLRSYEQRVREMLQEMAVRSHGRIHLQVIDPVPYSDDESNAEGGGLTAASGGSNGERVFFGLVGNTMSGTADADGRAAPDRIAEKTLSIPFFDPAREAFLEYDIAKLLYELNQSNKPLVGVISSLPVDGNPLLGVPPWTVMQQLNQLFDVKMLDQAKLQVISDRIKVLLLIHPQDLSVSAQYAIDQYVLRGGHLVVFVDPDAELETPAVTAVGPSWTVRERCRSNLPAAASIIRRCLRSARSSSITTMSSPRACNASMSPPLVTSTSPTTPVRA